MENWNNLKHGGSHGKGHWNSKNICFVWPMAWKRSRWHWTVMNRDAAELHTFQIARVNAICRPHRRRMHGSVHACEDKNKWFPYDSHYACRMMDCGRVITIPYLDDGGYWRVALWLCRRGWRMALMGNYSDASLYWCKQASLMWIRVFKLQASSFKRHLVAC
jgi:hypothetical protein